MATRRRSTKQLTGDGGLGVVRVKPLGVGGGGVEASAGAGNEGLVDFDVADANITVGGREFTYPRHVISPEADQEALYNEFMPARVARFMEGVNVNVMAYGQTGSGKTHTVFGPPGIMARAATGELGDGMVATYGLFPRTLLDVYARVQALRAAGEGAVLTGSAVEMSITGNEDMLSREEMARMKAAGVKGSGGWGCGDTFGISIDKTTKPPRLLGMKELRLETAADIREMYAGLATRNTVGTGMNDSSSRSHCFVTLILRRHDAASDTVRTSRLQFVDLAGSERIIDAHGTLNWKEGGKEAMNGLMTNYSLMMLSSCVRALLEARRKKTPFSFRTFLVDLVTLLQDSLSGTAETACFVCMSQAPGNVTQSKHALDFGEVFARLELDPQVNKAVPREKLLAAMPEGSLGPAPTGGNKYAMIRWGQARDAAQQRAILADFAPAA